MADWLRPGKLERTLARSELFLGATRDAVLKQIMDESRRHELLEELARRESRLQKIREAKAALVEEAREKAEHERAATEKKLAEGKAEEQRTGKKERGRKPEPPDPDQARPGDKVLRRSQVGGHGNARSTCKQAL